MTRLALVPALLIALSGHALAQSAHSQVNPAQSASTQAKPARGYQFHAEGTTGGVRWGYSSLYRAPVSDAAHAGCRWEMLPTPYGARYRPVCP